METKRKEHLELFKRMVGKNEYAGYEDKRAGIAGIYGEDKGVLQTTQTSKPRNMRNARTGYEPIGASKQVVVPFCPECGMDFKGVECKTMDTRFVCPECGTSIANTRQNRCGNCGVMCASSEDLNVHLIGGCNASR